MHIDDDKQLLQGLSERLADKLGMNNKLGDARSLEGAEKLIKQLLQEGKTIDLIFLDRDFLNYEDDETAGREMGDQFLEKFEKLAKDPEFNQRLKDTRIVMMTSHAGDEKAMAGFKKISSRVIGGLEGKGYGEQDSEMIKRMLVDAGVVKAESEAPVETEITPKARAREIAEKWAATIPEADRKLTDPKQVEKILYVLENAYNPSSDLFSNVDKLGQNFDPAAQAMEKGDIRGLADAYRAFAEDPIATAQKIDKVHNIAQSTLPESVRTALLSIILKEGDHPAAAMAKDTVAGLEQTKDMNAMKTVREKYLPSTNPEMARDQQLRQQAARQLLEELYPDTLKSDAVTLLRDMQLPHQDQGNKDIVQALAERYQQVVGEVAFPSRYRGDLHGAQNAGEVVAKLKDGSIAGRDVGAVVGVLQRELRKVIAQKATATGK